MKKCVTCGEIKQVDTYAWRYKIRGIKWNTCNFYQNDQLGIKEIKQRKTTYKRPFFALLSCQIQGDAHNRHFHPESASIWNEYTGDTRRRLSPYWDNLDAWQVILVSVVNLGEIDTPIWDKTTNSMKKSLKRLWHF